MLTDRYTQWAAMLAKSDAALVHLVTLSLGAVLLWEYRRRLPEPWRARASVAYLVGALVVGALVWMGG